MQTVIPATSLFLFIGALILVRRIRSMHKPTKGKGKRIILPLLFLTPGFVFFLNPGHVTYLQLLIAISLGIGLSIPLIIWSDYEIRNDGLIYTKKSPAFIITFALMIALRYYFRQHISIIDPGTLSMLIFLITICYLIPWRIACYIKFKKVLKQKNTSSM
ncbi:CcdC family protein [Bacillus thuringiensis]|uniref:Cytochrome c biogenesis protein CcdC n=1 Tax=Bacillus thuringiensis TaxID=1428 RepID=A0A9W3YH37_BACTU|nr:cytochrome c biogenesis protein CcdC [Bacillus thuringiensis]AMR06551.1 cobalamin biosynthesis protein CbiX [Bacillus thuringiensis]AYF81302.1 cytochrome c biogenesis protein CcdC [Bacillus thuringiensis]PNK34663.1 cytochrome c biogenesis protein CcdC [Bacillus thuringiensis]